MIRAAAIVVVVALAAVAPTAHAQRGAREVSATFLLVGDELPVARTTTIGIGLRRGIGEVTGLRFVDPADQLAARGVPDAVRDALDDLDAIADQLRGGDASDAAGRIERAVALFEDNLVAVKRAQLVDAYILQAVASCRVNRRRRCATGFERVLVFREEAEYDTARYPAELAGEFEQARAAVGARPRVTLTITTEPEGAEVFVDGRSAGPSPATADSLVPGDHYVTVKLIGYEKLVQRVTVGENGSTTGIELRPLRDRLVFEQTLPRIRESLGERRAPVPLVSFVTSRILADQCVVGVVTPGQGGDVSVVLYLYDMRSRLLLARREGSVPASDATGDAAIPLVTELYAGVDLTGQVAAPEDRVIVEPAPPLWQRWWFWTAVGVVVVSGAVAIAYATQPTDDVPDGFLRIDGTIQ